MPGDQTWLSHKEIHMNLVKIEVSGKSAVFANMFVLSDSNLNDLGQFKWQ